MAGRSIDPALEDGRATDIVIPVMGPTKAGKSSFLNRLAGSRTFEVGGRLASCTSSIGSLVLSANMVPAHLLQDLGSRRIVLVDTPGFDDTHMGDEEVLNRIVNWLTSSYRKGMRVGGVLYLHDISRDGFPGSSFRNLKMFRKLCGSRAMDRVLFITTKWDRLTGDIAQGMERVKELKSDFWNEMLELGATVHHVQPSGIQAKVTGGHRHPWDIIHEIVRSTKVRETREDKYLLEVQDEIINQRRFLPETDAGRELRINLEELLATAKRLRRQAIEDARAGRSDASLKARQDEIAKLTSQLKAMKLPGFGLRFLRLLGHPAEPQTPALGRLGKGTIPAPHILEEAFTPKFGFTDTVCVKLKAPEMAPTQSNPVLGDIRESDIVIPVLGLMKAGKSSFLNELVGREEFEVGHKLAPCTKAIKSYTIRAPPEGNRKLLSLLNGRRVVLIDTPGFDQTHLEDDVVLKEITDWMDRSYRQRMRIAAVLYLHDVSNHQSEAVVKRNIALFSAMCGEEAMSMVAFVTTKWDRLTSEDEAKAQVEELEKDYWRQVIDGGAHVFHLQPKDLRCQLSQEYYSLPWDIIRQTLVSAENGNASGRPLQIQDDIVRQRLDLLQTMAGKELGRRKVDHH
ncbi:hypothetical protein NMY22_g2656 [Coprinellus aureogranulatus]|nr:hypothetical protein NMY22_g2656 [Coprinellus aureogranulatus]